METSNRYSIAKLHSEHENSVVHDQSLTQINPIKDGKILVMWLLTPIGHLLSMLAEKAMLDESVRGVNLVNDRIGVPIRAQCKDCNFVFEIDSAQAVQ